VLEITSLGKAMQDGLPPVTKSQLTHDLTGLGVEPGQVVMLHVSVRAIGWVVGGPDVVLKALLDLLTPEGTLMMYVAWEDRTDHLREWSAERQAAYLEECPPFDPATSRANRKWSILAEYLRTWPGACRSGNPGASMVAVGARARWLTDNHPLQYGYGPGLPLAKLCETGGRVLQIGVSRGTITLLHYSEHMAAVPNKRTVKYPAPILENGQRVWVEIEEFDTSKGIVDWDRDYLPVIAESYLAEGKGRAGEVGAAQAYLFDAADLHHYAVEWMEKTLA
jgi:aminoglycoside 3-N-acetyltransferase